VRARTTAEHERSAARPGRQVPRPDTAATPRGAVRRELARLGRGPRKRLGQHFLVQPGIAQRIVELARLGGKERVVEIGPGLGALTDRLAARAADLWLVEVDADLAQRLRVRYADRRHVHVVEADVLAVDFPALLGPGSTAVVVANLPYNIATAVLAKLLADPRCFARLVVMVQREVAERLRAQPGGKAYGVLSVLTQFAARVHSGMRVGPGAFVPPPKVDSEVIVVEPHREPPVPVRDPLLLRRVVTTAFGQRRKQLANSLRPLCANAAGLLQSVGIDPARRPETLSLAEFAALTDALAMRA
jgi:16S rRNA (adenine1518-N6/adenine1519-N6)-dimethyltransferase